MLLVRAGFADAFIDWHEFLDIEPIDYFAAQPEVMEKLSAAIQKLKIDPVAAERFQALLVNAERRLLDKAAETPRISKLCERFGTSGAKCVADSILDWLKSRR
jgi:2,3-bisphosphoglycerate-independent phosphoglycerate mutase